MIVFGIKNCDTVKKARRWLDAHEVDYQFHDLRQDGLDKKTIENWLQSVDWETLLNKRGTTWRKLDDPRKDSLDQATAVDLMLENPTLIKRPVVETDKACFVGFKDTEFAEKLGL
jgi:arsenate reductase